MTAKLDEEVGFLFICDAGGEVFESLTDDFSEGLSDATKRGWTYEKTQVGGKDHYSHYCKACSFDRKAKALAQAAAKEAAEQEKPQRLPKRVLASVEFTRMVADLVGPDDNGYIEQSFVDDAPEAMENLIFMAREALKK